MRPSRGAVSIGCQSIGNGLSGWLDVSIAVGRQVIHSARLPRVVAEFRPPIALRNKRLSLILGLEPTHVVTASRSRQQLAHIRAIVERRCDHDDPGAARAIPVRVICHQTTPRSLSQITAHPMTAATAAAYSSAAALVSAMLVTL